MSDAQSCLVYSPIPMRARISRPASPCKYLLPATSGVKSPGEGKKKKL